MKNKNEIEQMAGVIDHTFLKTEAEGVSIEDQKKAVTQLVSEADKYNAYSVCVRESMVNLCVNLKDKLNSKIKICSVVGFPDGDKFSTEEKIELLLKVKASGADEFDMVIRVKDLINGEYQKVEREIELMSQNAGDKVLKIIFENYYLNTNQKLKAYEIAQNAFENAPGVRFFKTSTGFVKGDGLRPIGATLEDVKLMHTISRGKFGLKPAGGVNNFEQARQFWIASGSPVNKDGYIDPLKFRIGSSSLLQQLYMNKSVSDGY